MIKDLPQSVKENLTCFVKLKLTASVSVARHQRARKATVVAEGEPAGEGISDSDEATRVSGTGIDRRQTDGSMRRLLGNGPEG